MIAKLFGFLSADLGVDLGTANVRVAVRGRGIVLNEPSVVAVKKGSNELLRGGFGRAAKEMLGRAPQSIDVIRPLQGGVVADFDMTRALLEHCLHSTGAGRGWLGPRVVINVPTGITAVEKRAVFNAADRAGARKVYLVEEPRAAGLGAGLPIHEPKACMVVDVGGGTTDVSILSLGDVVISHSIKVAGDAMDEAIVQHLRRNYNVLIGANTAEELKIRLGSASRGGAGPTADGGDGVEPIEIRGRDLIAGVPRSVLVTPVEVREALEEPVSQIIELVRRSLEETGPELSGDLLERGLTLCGGGALLRGLREMIVRETGLHVQLAEQPMETVVRGTAVFVEHIDAFASILESAEDDL